MQNLAKTDLHCTQDAADPLQGFSLDLLSSKQICDKPVLDVRFLALPSDLIALTLQP